MSDEQPSIRGEYVEHGVRQYYETHGADYRNPHEPIIREVLALATQTWTLDLAHVLDLACGSGEVTLALRPLGATNIEGIDPYTAQAYHERTGQTAAPFTFEQIASGALTDRRYSLIVCSFALHLVAVSWLPGLCYQLSQLAPALLILTPHKRPVLKPEWGWSLYQELIHKRVRARLYTRIEGTQ
jgi:SAM-dependent methyltransferase